MTLRITAHGPNGEVDITDGVQVIYDQLVGSMDWGSGFLSTEEVATIRAVAAVCGFEQIPYQHDRCVECSHDRGDHRPHYEESVVVADSACFYRRRDVPVTSWGRGPDCPCSGFRFS